MDELTHEQGTVLLEGRDTEGRWFYTCDRCGAFHTKTIGYCNECNSRVLGIRDMGGHINARN